MSENGVERKKCRHCDETFRARQIADYADVLRHYLDEHPGSDRLVDVFRGVVVEVDCQSCGETFLADLNVGSGRLGAASHCPGCCERDKIRGLFAQELRATEAISRAACGTLLPDAVDEERADTESTGVERSGGRR